MVQEGIIEPEFIFLNKKRAKLVAGDNNKVVRVEIREVSK